MRRTVAWPYAEKRIAAHPGRGAATQKRQNMSSVPRSWDDELRVREAETFRAALSVKGKAQHVALVLRFRLSTFRGRTTSMYRPEWIAEATGYSAEEVENALRELADRRLVTFDGFVDEGDEYHEWLWHLEPFAVDGPPKSKPKPPRVEVLPASTQKAAPKREPRRTTRWVPVAGAPKPPLVVRPPAPPTPEFAHAEVRSLLVRAFVKNTRVYTVALALLTETDDRGHVRASAARLAWATGISSRHVPKALHALVGTGAVRRGPNNRGHSPFYDWNVPRLRSLEPDA